MTLIIAEAGVNHNGDEHLAIKLIDAAHASGADVVKFQTFSAKKMVTMAAKQATYQIENSQIEESQYSMLRRLELSFDAHKRLLAHCEKLGLEFLSTAFDSESLNFLVDTLGVKRLKIPSGEITNAPLVLEHAKTGLEIIVSTGMATLSEIETVLGVIAFGYLGAKGAPGKKAFEEAYQSDEGLALLRERVSILHCTTEYPAPTEEVNLSVMKTLNRAFGLKVGYSDHTQGTDIPIAAVAMGAEIIEKHFTLDRNLEGPDHKASLEPDELNNMVKSIRKVEVAIGDGVKRPTKSEINNKVIARKSLVAGRSISQGEILSSDSIDVKRPGCGMSPMEYWDVLGRESSSTYSAGEALDE
ncbi:N-acetylneuraminate synthase [Alteromonadaceae bacterium Bs31]|nr:N-acetylneuraminate synthase [Alteromonadaceae bacterium Bs31]